MAPPCGFTCSASSGRPSWRSTARPWLAKASFSSMTSISPSVRPVRSSSLRTAGAGPMPMMRGGTPAVAIATTRARGVRPWRFAAVFGGQDQRRGAVVHARGVAGGDGCPGCGTGFSASPASPSWYRGAGCSSRSTIVSPLRALSVTGAISRAKKPLACAPWRAVCWLRSANASWSARLIWNSSATFSAGFRHRIGAVRRLHQAVDEAPADGRVVDLGLAGEGLGGLAHDERRAGHAFDAAGQHQLSSPAADRARGGADGVEAGAAQPVDGGARTLWWAGRRAAQPCERRCGCPPRPGWRSP